MNKHLNQAWVVIILGMVGSGLWSFIGEPIIKFFLERTISLVSLLSDVYLEAIYHDVGKGLYESKSDYLYSIFSGLISGLLIAAPVWVYSDINGLKQKLNKLELIEEAKTSNNSEAIKKLKSSLLRDDVDELINSCKSTIKKGWLFFYFLCVAGLCMITLLTGLKYTNEYTRSAVIYIERSIDILAPHVGTNEYLQLKSQYRSISNRQQFINLYQILNEKAKDQKITLPDFRPL